MFFSCFFLNIGYKMCFWCFLLSHRCFYNYAFCAYLCICFTCKFSIVPRRPSLRHGKSLLRNDIWWSSMF